MTKKYHIGIDLGGTKTEIAILDANLNLIYKKRLPTESANGPEHVVSQISLLYNEAKAFISAASHSVGVGTPGSLSIDKGLLRNSNTLCLNGLPLKKLIEDKIQHEIYVENDANCFALAEAIMGSGKGHQLVFGVIMDVVAVLLLINLFVLGPRKSLGNGGTLYFIAMVLNVIVVKMVVLKCIFLGVGLKKSFETIIFLILLQNNF